MKLKQSLYFVALLLVTVGCATTNGPPVDGNPQFAFQLLSATTTRGLARDVWVEGDTAYVADDEYGVTIWDVSNLARPVMIDSIQTLGPVEEIAYSQSTGLIFTLQTSSLGGITVFDKTTKIEQIKHGNGRSNGFRFKHLPPDTLLFIEVEPDNDGCQFAASYRDPLAVPWWTYDFHAPYTPGFGVLTSLELDSNYVYLAHGQYGVSIIKYDYTQIGPGFAAVPLGRVDTPGMARDLKLSRDRNHLFVADNQSGLQVINISDKTHPRIVGISLPPNVNDAKRIRTVGDTAIFIEPLRGIFAVDCNIPTSPRYFGTYSSPDPQGIFIRESDQTIFLTDLDQGLLVLKFRQ